MSDNPIKERYWQKVNRNAIRMKCKHFNARVLRFYEGRKMEKTRYDTWGKCSNDCIRHLSNLRKPI